MGEEAYQIKDYFHDEAVAFAGAMHPKGSLAHNSDEMYSSAHDWARSLERKVLDLGPT